MLGFYTLFVGSLIVMMIMVMDAISHSLGDILVILDNNPDYTQHRHQSCNEDLRRLCKGSIIEEDDCLIQDP